MIIRSHKRDFRPLSWVTGVVSILYLVFLTDGLQAAGLGVIHFDELPGQNDAERLARLPGVLRSQIRTAGTKYSQLQSHPQPGTVENRVRVVFTSRMHDFKAVSSPIDLGDNFEFVSDGRAIFECGPKGFIRFSQRNTLIQDIVFLGPKKNVPPLIIYATGESQQWKPGGGRAPETTPKAIGREMDGGYVWINRCYFKGLGVALRTRPGQHTNCTFLRISDSVFYNVTQLSDYLKTDACVIEKSWFTPNVESDKAFIVNYDALVLRDIVATPQTGFHDVRKARWIDNYGPVCDIQSSRFGNELINRSDPLRNDQMSLVYQYAPFTTTWVNPQGTVRQELDRRVLRIQDNQLYSRNVPVVKFFAMPNHVVIRGNTGLIGNWKQVETGKYVDRSVLCGFDKGFIMPDVSAAPHIAIEIESNLRDLPITAENPDSLPMPLCLFGAQKRGTLAVTRPTDQIPANQFVQASRIADAGTSREGFTPYGYANGAAPVRNWKGNANWSDVGISQPLPSARRLPDSQKGNTAIWEIDTSNAGNAFVCYVTVIGNPGQAQSSARSVITSLLTVVTREIGGKVCREIILTPVSQVSASEKGKLPKMRVVWSSTNDTRSVSSEDERIRIEVDGVSNKSTEEQCHIRILMLG